MEIQEWFLNSGNYWVSEVPAVNETWLKRCDHGQFFTTLPMEDPSIPFTTVFSGFDDSYSKLFYKTMAAFHFAYTEISDKFEWYVKADDDSFVVVEHLKEYLSQLDPKKPYYIGHPRKYQLEHGYNSGAGYVLSNGAVKLFVEKAYGNTTICPFDEAEDLGFGRCLANIGIYPIDTRNSDGQHRFSAYSLKSSFEPNERRSKFKMWPEKQKYEAFSPEIITFHHLSPHEIRMIEILLYRTNDPRQSGFFQS